MGGREARYGIKESTTGGRRSTAVIAVALLCCRSDRVAGM